MLRSALNLNTGIRVSEINNPRSEVDLAGKTRPQPPPPPPHTHTLTYPQMVIASYISTDLPVITKLHVLYKSMRFHMILFFFLFSFFIFNMDIISCFLIMSENTLSHTCNSNILNFVRQAKKCVISNETFYLSV